MPVLLLFIPSPSMSGFSIGPLRIHFYALSIMAGIAVAWWLARKRYRERGGDPDQLEGILVWTVIWGIVGTRIYHVITDYQLYFGPGRNPWNAFKIWEGGLGIWGGVALGGLVTWWLCRRRGIVFSAVADVLAPCLLIAQALGRLGNWFNQELFGRPTTLPWGLEIAPQYRPDGYAQYTTFHPTFLYELIWCLLGAAFLLFAERRWRLGRGRLFVLYIMWYTFGRLFIEHLRIDKVNTAGGFRLNEYTSVIVFIVSVIVFVWLTRMRPGVDDHPFGHPAEPERASDTDDVAQDDDHDGQTETSPVT